MIVIDLTPQEVFDKVATHLLTQMKVSWGESGCLYRGPNGLRCAAGCLIPEDQYDPGMEGFCWDTLVEEGHCSPHNKELISSLQEVHDVNHPGQWKHLLSFVATNYALNSSILTKF